MNYHRMTIREFGDAFQVFKLKPEHNYAGAVSGGGHRTTSWFVSAAAKPQFTGSYSGCCNYIASEGAQYMSEHGIPA